MVECKVLGCTNEATHLTPGEVTSEVCKKCAHPNDEEMLG